MKDFIKNGEFFLWFNAQDSKPMICKLSYIHVAKDTAWIERYEYTDFAKGLREAVRESDAETELGVALINLCKVLEKDKNNIKYVLTKKDEWGAALALFEGAEEGNFPIFIKFGNVLGSVL
jgi:hypothetical protein